MKMNKRDQFAKRAKEIFAQENKTWQQKLDEYNEFLKIQTIFKRLAKHYRYGWWWAVDEKVKQLIAKTDFTKYKSWRECERDFNDKLWNFRDYWNYKVLKINENSYDFDEYIWDYRFLSICNMLIHGIVELNFNKANPNIVEMEQLQQALGCITVDSDVKEIIRKRIDYLTK